MIKTIITPQSNSVNLTIPGNYVGKEIEVLLYAKEEVAEGTAVPKKSMADFCGVLSENDYQALKEHTEQARKEWNRAI